MAELREQISRLNEKLMLQDVHLAKLTVSSFESKELALKIKQLRMENESLQSKLRFMEKNSFMQPRESIGMSRVPTTATQMSGAHMEDEPGELFNNTYLSQLQTGGSQASLDVYSAEELQKRNSVCPQHMRSSYVMHGIDRNLSEREMRVR